MKQCVRINSNEKLSNIKFGTNMGSVEEEGYKITKEDSELHEPHD